MKRTILSLARPFLILAAWIPAVSVVAQDAFHSSYVWTGGNGRWDDAAMWRREDGASGVPGAMDRAWIASDRPIAVEITDGAACHTLRVGGRMDSVIVTGAPEATLSIHGNWNMEGKVRWNLRGTVLLSAREAGSVNTRAIKIPGDVKIDGGSWELHSALHLDDGAALEIRRGRLRTNDHALKAGALTIHGRATDRLDPGSSIILLRSFPKGDPRSLDGAGIGLMVNGEARRWDGGSMPMEDYLRSAPTCGTGPGQTPFTVTASCTTDYNGFCVSCNGTCDAGVVVNISGGIGPFSIQWSGGPTTATWAPVCDGNKLVLVTDLGQSIGCFANVQVTEPPPLGVFFFGLDQPTCADVCNGSATTFPGGGVGFGYVYDWNNGAESGQNPSQLCAGLNTLQLTDANNCVYDTAFTIQLLPLTVTLTTADAGCFGDCDGTAGVVVGGGVPPYDYEWEPGAPAGDGTPDVTGLCAGNYTIQITDQNGCDTTLTFTIDELAPIVPNPVHTDATCSSICDGTAGVSPSGASGPFDFDWAPDPIAGDGTPNVTGLCAGDFTVTITDIPTGCDTTITITILAPPALDVELTTTDVTCAGDCDGTGVLTIGGGTPGYSITWAPGPIIGQGTPNASQLCPGNYTVNVTDAAGCDTTIAFTINEPPPILPDESHTDISCAGACDGTAQVNPTGGSGALSITWSPNPPVGQNTCCISQLCAGDWTATITDSLGCDTSVTITIIEPLPLIATPSQTNVTCGGSCDGTASVSVSGGTPPPTFLWTPAPPLGQGTDSISGLCPGPWSVLITDANGCTTTVNFTILDAVPLQFSLQVNDASCPSACDGDAGVIVSGGQPPYQYDWDPDAINGDGTPNVTDLCPGAYTLTVTDALGCDSTIAFTVGSQPAILPNEVATNTTCNGGCDGSIILSPTGGTGVFTYDWTPTPPNGDGTASALNLCAGVWSVTINSGACDTTLSITITGPPPFDITLLTTNAVCNGDCNGTASITAIGGGTPGYDYLWSPAPGGGQGTADATGLCTGAWSVTITDDAGCDTTLAFTITEPPPIDPQLTTTQAGCGGACDGTASVASGFASYDWAPGPITGDGTPAVSGLCSGMYTVTITNAAGCDTTVQFFITTPSGIEADAFVSSASCADVCDGSIFVNLISVVFPVTFDWTPDPPNGDGTANATGLCAGQWVLFIQDGAGCDTVMVFDVGSPTAILPNAIITNETCNGPCDGTASFPASGGTPGYTFFWTPVPTEGQGVAASTTLCAGAYTVLITDAAGCDTLVAFEILPAQPIDAQLTTTDVSCFGDCDGTATVDPSGGTPPYLITWTPSPGGGQGDTTATGLCPGNWSVTVEDVNGCDTTIAFTISEPSPIVPDLVTVDESCAGPCSGSASVNPGGGSGSYGYDWQPPPGGGQNTPNATGLCAGVNYTVTVSDSSGCDTTIAFTIGTYAAIVPNASSIPTSCSNACDGMATVGPTGGVPPYDYFWAPTPPGGNFQPQATGLCAGLWNVTITDSLGCDTMISLLITGPEAFVDNAVAVGPSCNGECDGNISVAVTGGSPPYLYDWEPDPINGDGSSFAAGYCAGTVTLLLTDNNGCDSLFTYVLSEPPPIAVSADATPSQCQLCIGTITMHASGGSPPFSYFVTSPDTLFFTTDSVFSGLCAGIFTVQVQDASGCSMQLVVPITDSNAEVLTTTDGDVACPDDCDGTVSVSFTCSDPPCTIAWYNGLGVDLGQSGPVLTGLCAGIYLAEVTNASGCIAIDTAMVNAPDPIVANSSSTPVSCVGTCDGTATVGPTGGTPPYDYDWSPDPPGGDGGPQATGLCAGVWNVTITDAAGCGTTAGVLVLAPQPITASAVIVDLACGGVCDASIVVNASGGAGGFSYDWTPDPPIGEGTHAVQDLCAGDWTVTITDGNNCTATFTYTINEPTPIILDASITNSQCGLCNGGATVNISGGSPPFGIAWMDQGGNTIGTGPAIGGLCGGIYTVNVTDAMSCTALLAVPIIDVNGEMLATTDGFTTCANTCDGTVSVSYVCSQPPCNVEWFDALGASIGFTTDTATGLCAGEYLVMVTNAAGCVSIDTAGVAPSQIIIPNLSSIPVNCAGACDGMATVGPAGGVAPYTFNWEPDPLGGDSLPQATGLCAGVYTVTIADASGCDTTVSVLILEPQPITAAGVISDVTCAGDCNGGIVVTPAGGTAPYNYDWSPDPPNGDGGNGAFDLCAGDWVLTITDNNGCTADFTFTVNQPPPLALSASVIPSECQLCIGEAVVTATGGTPPYAFAWLDPDGILIGTDSAMTGLCAGLYTAVVSDAAGCGAQLIVPVTDSNGEALSTSTTATTCPSSCDGTANVDFFCGDPPCAIAWYDALGNDLGGSGNGMDSLCAGIYFVQVTNASLCLSIDTAIVTAPPPINANLSTTPVSCFGLCDGSATVGPTGGTGTSFTYDWSPGPIIGDSTAQVTGLCAGIYSVLITDSVGCDTTIAVLIIEPQLLTVSAAITDVACAGDSTGSIVVTPGGGTPGYLFDWSPVPPNGDSTANALGLIAGDWTVTITDANGCDTTITYTISEPPALQAQVSPSHNLCFGDCEGSAATVISGGVPPYAITWFDGGGGVIAQDSLAIDGLCAGNYLMSAMDLNGCITEVSFQITEGAPIDAALAFTGETCFGPCDGAAVIAPSGGTGVFSIVWTDPFGNTFAIDTTAVNGLCAGTWSVGISDTLGCDTSIAFTVLPYAPIVPNTGLTQVTCNGACDGGIVLAPSGGIGSYDFAWSPVPPNGDGTNLATDLCPGNWSVTITDDVGCDTTFTFTITEPDALALIVDGIVDASCATAPDGAIAITVGGGTPAYQTNWQGPGGFTSGTEDINDLLPGAYLLTITDDNGCTLDTTLIVGALTTIVADAGIDTSFCGGTAVVLDGSGSTGATSYLWQDGDGNTVGTTAIVTLTGLASGTYTFTLTVTDGPCSAADQVTVTVLAPPIADAGQDQTIFIQDVATLGGDPSGPPGSVFTWMPDSLVNDPSLPNPIADPGQSQWFVLTVISPNGCTDIDSVFITVVPDVVIPSGFTPNSDGWNDEWIIDFIDLFPDCEVEIYSRWGELLFQSDGYAEPWDGTYNGGEVPIGTYYYVVKLNDPDFPEPYTGPLTVLR